MVGSQAIAEDRPTGSSPSGVQLLPKVLTGINGLDEITGGGFPQGRSTLVCGPAGCGKTLLSVEFLVQGISQFNESGVFIAFEETAEDLAANVASLGFDLDKLVAEEKLVVDHIRVAGEEIEEAGEWDLDGLFLRLGAAIDSVGAKRVVIDSIEALFGEFSNTATLRSELRRLFSWLKDRGVTSVITGERGEGTLTRHGIEEYVSDCVIILDNRVVDQTSIRRLRILKYRGSLHGTNEYPFLISEKGISVLPITSGGLAHSVSTERVSSGVPRLDAMLGIGGFYKGSVILVTGTPGTGKSTLAAQFCDAACRRGDRALYFAFEESQSEIIRNMSSVGIDLAQWVNTGLLQFRCARPSLQGLEAHLIAMHRGIETFQPAVVVQDPVSDLLRSGTGKGTEVSALLSRQVDFLKTKGVTAMFTSLNSELGSGETEQESASLIDTWILLQTVEGNGEHNRVLRVLKSRGMSHSNQIREFSLTDGGIELADVYVGSQGVLTGSARSAQEAKERSDAMTRLDDLEQLRTKLDRRREAVEAQTALLWHEFEDEAASVERLLDHGATDADHREEQGAEQSRIRQADEVALVGDVPDLESSGS